MFVGPDKTLCPGTSPLSHPVQPGGLPFPEPLLVYISAMPLLLFTEREKKNNNNMGALQDVFMYLRLEFFLLNGLFLKSFEL